MATNVQHNFAHRYLQYAAEIIEAYDGKVPLHYFIKQSFAKQKKFGSRDRKAISQVVYSYYRVSNALRQMSLQQALPLALLLTTTPSPLWESVVPVAWHNIWQGTPIEKWNWAQQHFTLNASIFPHSNYVSTALDVAAFNLSHLQQPDVFIRIRNIANTQRIIQQLTDHNITFEVLDNCIRLPQQTAVDTMLAIDKDVVIQDWSSQQVASMFALVRSNITQKKQPITWWDCCAASGGKSIAAYDYFGKQLQLTATDVRSSILHNLKNRFSTAGINIAKTFVHNAATPSLPFHEKFEVVLADVPCSGSGTWGRTPEQLYFSEEASIEQYQQLQRNIANNVVSNVKQGGFLLYVTCSVFSAENEQNVQYLLATHQNLTLVEQKYFSGYHHKADTLFAALMQKL
ncbi:MAG TPA: Fmu (Sun) domain protein [Chitinophagaceae bacterium]|nr:Fmu (Sun) domain protein [Chitinophagaceae bacterium]HAN37935.1 Fmu (Sun) domain protein [Chitinophagaceae bacterium]